MHSILFFLLKGIVTPHLGPNVLTLNVLYDLLKTWWVEQWSHVKDIWFAFAALLWPFCVWSVCVPEEALGLKHSPNPLYPDSPHPTIPMARPAVFLCCVMTGLCPPGGRPPQPVPPRSGTRQHFLLSLGAFPHRFEHPSLISGISLISLWTMRTLSLARSPVLSVSCPLLRSCGFLFIQIFPLFSIRRLCLALSLFYPFLRSPQAPQWDPCFPSQRCLSALLSSSIPAHGKSWRQSAVFINSFYLVRAEVVPACISLYRKV